MVGQIDILIIGTGFEEKLQVSNDTLNDFKNYNIHVVVLPTSEAIHKYNTLVDYGQAVGALLHSTC